VVAVRTINVVVASWRGEKSAGEKSPHAAYGEYARIVALHSPAPWVRRDVAAPGCGRTSSPALRRIVLAIAGAVEW